MKNNILLAADVLFAILRFLIAGRFMLNGAL